MNAMNDDILDSMDDEETARLHRNVESVYEQQRIVNQRLRERAEKAEAEAETATQLAIERGRVATSLQDEAERLASELKELHDLFLWHNKSWSERCEKAEAEYDKAIAVAADYESKMLDARAEVADLRREHDEETDEFNAGCTAYDEGVSCNEAESYYRNEHPDRIDYDVFGCGYAWAASGYGKHFDAIADLRRQVAEARAEADEHHKAMMNALDARNEAQGALDDATADRDRLAERVRVTAITQTMRDMGLKHGDDILSHFAAELRAALEGSER